MKYEFIFICLIIPGHRKNRGRLGDGLGIKEIGGRRKMEFFISYFIKNENTNMNMPPNSRIWVGSSEMKMDRLNVISPTIF
jgi:hypothetical protein